MRAIERPEWLKSKIGRRFAFYTTVIGAIMALILSFIISYQQYQERIAFLKKELDTVVTANKSFIEESLWILDTRSLGLVMKGYTLNGDIVFFQITDENGKVVVSRGVSDPANNIVKRVPLYHHDKGRNIFLGTLTVEASKQSAFRKARSFILLALIQSMLLMFTLSVAIIFLFHHLVSKHLIAIKRYTEGITLGEQQEPLILDRPFNGHTKDDELSSTVDAINLMCRKIFDAYKDLEEHTEERIKLERQLQQAQKMETIGRLAGGVAHDFNNVLTSILGYSELLLMEMDDDDPHREFVEIIHSAGEKASTLTRQLLAFSRKQILEKKVVCINTLIKDLLKILGKMLGDDVEIQTSLEAKQGLIEADPGQMEQVLMNLCVNARDAMPKGGTIIIETKDVTFHEDHPDLPSDLKPGDYVMLAVTDTGVGMSKEVQEHIFDPFFTTKEEGKGTGLGLATVYGIIKQHGGYIYVHSEEGKGTTFTIYLPATKQPIDSSIPEEGGEVSLEHGSETILVVDDDPLVRRLVFDTLEPRGYKCIGAANGKEALEVLKNYPDKVHLLLTDVVMTGMSGKELADKVSITYPKLKVIFMSGYAEDTIARHGVLNQGVNFLSKPLTPVALIQKIESVLRDIRPKNE